MPRLATRPLCEDFRGTDSGFSSCGEEGSGEGRLEGPIALAALHDGADVPSAGTIVWFNQITRKMTVAARKLMTNA